MKPPRIEHLPSKKLIGISKRISLANNQTVALWKSFMPRRNEIINRVGDDFFSMQVYDSLSYHKNFNPKNEFIKWACVEVADFDNIPIGLESYELTGGLYAVFIHVGKASDFYKTAQYIFGQWLPNSEYELDERAHFELLGEKYKNNDSTSEEEVWIPIKAKTEK